MSFLWYVFCLAKVQPLIVYEYQISLALVCEMFCFSLWYFSYLQNNGWADIFPDHFEYKCPLAPNFPDKKCSFTLIILPLNLIFLLFLMVFKIFFKSLMFYRIKRICLDMCLYLYSTVLEVHLDLSVPVFVQYWKLSAIISSNIASPPYLPFSSGNLIRCMLNFSSYLLFLFSALTFFLFLFATFWVSTSVLTTNSPIICLQVYLIYFISYFDGDTFTSKIYF